MQLAPKHIYTDKLNIYTSLLSKNIHKNYPRCINHIERMNLTLRTRLKRLNRKTICFTRSEQMFHNVVYLWVFYSSQEVLEKI
jgi:IS1 family transposase